MRESRFLRQRFVCDVFAIARLEIFKAEGMGVAYLCTGQLETLPDFVLASGASVDAVACGSDGRNGHVFPRQMRFALLGNGDAEALEEGLCRRAFEAEGKCVRGFVFERDIVGNDVVIDVLHHGFARFGLEIDKKGVFKAENVGVADDAALGREEEGVSALTGLQLLDVIGAERVDEASAIFASGADSAMC